jgi:hypothetical protein
MKKIRLKEKAAVTKLARSGILDTGHFVSQLVLKFKVKLADFHWNHVSFQFKP